MKHGIAAAILCTAVVTAMLVPTAKAEAAGMSVGRARGTLN